MDNGIFDFSYPWIVTGSMHNVNEHFTSLWIVNSIIHLQLDELVYLHLIQQDPKPK